eukprot:COSAG04_NODE_11508_length_705_cov_1.089109_2_plen_102_part_01
MPALREAVGAGALALAADAPLRARHLEPHLLVADDLVQHLDDFRVVDEEGGGAARAGALVRRQLLRGVLHQVDLLPERRHFLRAQDARPHEEAREVEGELLL